MSSANSVHGASDACVITPSRQARVRVITRDPFGVFARAAVRHKPRRLTIVSPWVSDGGRRAITLGRLIEHADRHDCPVVLVTRPATSAGHAAAIAMVRSCRRGVLHLNPNLHAKMFVCESCAGSGFALVGSANASVASGSLDELALLVRADRGSRIIAELAGHAVRGLMNVDRGPR